MLFFHSSGPLGLDDDGHLWERYRDGWAWLGPVASAEVSPGLEWHATELLQRWELAFDEREEQEASYRRSVLD